jgi:predicted aspartyl protease
LKKDELILPIDPSTGYAFVPTDIKGPGALYQANLLLDTGAAQTTLSTKLARILGYHLSSLKSEDVIVVGGHATSRLVQLDEVAVRGARLKLVGCRFMDVSPFDGLLGNDLLRKLNILVILDVKRQTARLVFRN